MQTHCLFTQSIVLRTIQKWHHAPSAHLNVQTSPYCPSLAGRACRQHPELAWTSPLTTRHKCARRRRLEVSAQAGSSSRQRTTQEIPIFPLGMVALPGAVTPLNIFEARLQNDPSMMDVLCKRMLDASSCKQQSSDDMDMHADIECCSAPCWQAMMGEWLQFACTAGIAMNTCDSNSCTCNPEDRNSLSHLWCRVEDGLINHESPFCGSKRFGISHVSSEGGVCQIGTLLKIEGHRKLPDGQITIFSRGLNSLNF